MVKRMKNGSSSAPLSRGKIDATSGSFLAKYGNFETCLVTQKRPRDRGGGGVVLILCENFDNHFLLLPPI